MAAKDIFHDVVKAALEQDGWIITADPLTIRVDTFTDLFIDLGAEKLIAAEKANQKIAIEIKSFLGQSVVSEFHTAIGQFTNYRYALADHEPERVLYLAVPSSIYDEFFTRPFIQSVIQRSQVSLLIYDIEIGGSLRWQS
jgi:XisH protein